MGCSFGIIMKPFKSPVRAFEDQRGLKDSKDGGVASGRAPMVIMV